MRIHQRSFVTVLAVAAMVSALASAPAAAGDDLDTRLMVSNCLVCHGPGGKSIGFAPQLTGMTAEKMLATLKEFTAGKRPSTIMKRIAPGYSDEQLQAITAHIAKMSQ